VRSKLTEPQKLLTYSASTEISKSSARHHRGVYSRCYKGLWILGNRDGHVGRRPPSGNKERVDMVSSVSVTSTRAHISKSKNGQVTYLHRHHPYPLTISFLGAKHSTAISIIRKTFLRTDLILRTDSASKMLSSSSTQIAEPRFLELVSYSASSSSTRRILPARSVYPRI